MNSLMKDFVNNLETVGFEEVSKPNEIFNVVEKVAKKYIKEYGGIKIFFRKINDKRGELVIIVTNPSPFKAEKFGVKINISLNETELNDGKSNEIKNAHPLVYVVSVNDRIIKLHDIDNDDMIKLKKDDIDIFFKKGKSIEELIEDFKLS
jgi:hypothetical protein